MAFYDDLVNADVISPLIGKVKINLTKEGKPIVVIGRSLEPSVPWLNHRVKQERFCDLWMYYYFKYYNIVPKSCRSCWKVVMKIDNLRQLMDVARKQNTMEYSCKCGPEQRAYTGAIGQYRAFWYGRLSEGLEGGRKVFKYVRNAFPGMNLILKRGCTEFENLYHPSSSWNKLAEERNWDELEYILNELFVVEDCAVVSTPDIMKPLIFKNWIDWAYEHGDKTYLDFVEGPPMPKLETYHSSSHEEKDYIGSLNEPMKVKGQFQYVATTEEEEQKESKIALIR